MSLANSIPVLAPLLVPAAPGTEELLRWDIAGDRFWVDLFTTMRRAGDLYDLSMLSEGAYMRSVWMEKLRSADRS